MQCAAFLPFPHLPSLCLFFFFPPLTAAYGMVQGLSEAFHTTEISSAPTISPAKRLSADGYYGRKKPPVPTIVGAVVGAVVLLALVILLFVCRRRTLRMSKKPLDNVVGVERGPDPDVDSSRSALLDGAGQPAGGDGASVSDAVSTTFSKKTLKEAPFAAITGGIVQGATLAGDTVLSLQRKFFKRPTAESTAEMELEPSALNESATDSPVEIPREGFFSKMTAKTKKNSTVSTTKVAESVTEVELDPSAPGTDDSATSPPEKPREGFFARITKKVKKDSTTTVAKETVSSDDAGLSFQERLFKRPTKDSIDTPQNEEGPAVSVDEPASDVDPEPETSVEETSANAVEETRKDSSDSTPKRPVFAGNPVLSLSQRLFKRTATDSTLPSNATPPEIDTVNEDFTIVTPVQSPTEEATEEIPLDPPKAGFMLKLRHKFSKPQLVTDLESARGSVETPFAPTDSQNISDAKMETSSRDSTIGHGSSAAASSSAHRESLPPPFDLSEHWSPSAGPSGTSVPVIRSLSTMKRDQTRAVHPEQGSSTYLAPPSHPPPPPDADAPPTATRSLSTMKRDQTRVISRDQQHSATDVLVQTPGGLQLMPGQSRVISTDQSRAVASELRDLREYIRALEADLAAGGNRGGADFPLLAPPPSYDETS
ncbi:hypothetical protein C8R43DRAFT_1115180 [Mycena crocata]|nr:hypothetical protein C8R43DRAFT_1115180 [Mycena crocata]